MLWFSKKRKLVQTSTFGSEFTAIKQAVKMTQDLHYKLRIFGIRLTGPASLYYDNEEVYNNISIFESVLNKNHHSVSYRACREAVAFIMIIVTREDTIKNLADLFTKIIPKVVCKILLDMIMYQGLPL